MKKIIPLLGFGFLLVIVLLGAVFLPRVVQKSDALSSENTGERVEGRFAAINATGEQGEVGAGEENLAPPEVSQGGASDAAQPSPALASGGSITANSAAATPSVTHSPPEEAAPEAAPAIALEPFFTALGAEDFAAARGFLTTNQEVWTERQ